MIREARKMRESSDILKNIPLDAPYVTGDDIKPSYVHFHLNTDIPPQLEAS